MERVPSLSPSSPGYLIAWVLGVEVGVRKGEATFLSFFFLGHGGQEVHDSGARCIWHLYFCTFFFQSKISSHMELMRWKMKAAAGVCVSY